MKEIKAVIQPFLLDKVLSALEAIEGLPGVTVSQVLGWGVWRSTDRLNRDPGHAFSPKSKLEIVVSDELAPRVVKTIMDAAHTGNPGDGKIFVSEVDEVLKIRSGERLVELSGGGKNGA